MTQRPKPPDIGKPLISPSALKVGKCLRRYGLQKIDRCEFPREDKPWLASGDRKHSHLHRYRLGDVPDLTDPEEMIAAAAIPHWHLQHWKPEQEILLDRGPFAYWGFSDQFGRAFVGDYKFTGKKANLPGFVEGAQQTTAELVRATAAKLRRDEQWIVYANACADFKKTSLILGQWTYVIPPAKDKAGNCKGEPTVIPVTFGESPATLARKLDKLDERAERMLHVRKAYAIPKSQLIPANRLRRSNATANAIPHSANAECQGVGIRCDFEPWCNLTNPGEIR